MYCSLSEVWGNNNYYDNINNNMIEHFNDNNWHLIPSEKKYNLI